MTGEKNRYKTSEQLWKFADETLTTPAHDELIFQLLDPDKYLSIISNYFERVSNESLALQTPNLDYSTGVLIFKTTEQRTAEQIKCEWAVRRNVIILNENSVIRESYRVITEEPIMSRSFIVGYWDIIVERIQYIKIQYWGIDAGYQETVLKVMERTNPEGLPFVSRVYLEVKPKIGSFGNTVRQIKTYQNYVKDSIGRTFLFTPDLRFKPQFESQGIKVISPNEVTV